MFDVLCVGILVADAIAKPVEKIPEKGKLETVERLTLHSGGCASSASIDMAKIGLKTCIAGKIGDDGFGRFMRAEIENNGVDTSGLAVSDTEGTSASLVIVTADGERSFIHCIGANGDLTEKDMDYSIVEKSNIVFVAGTMLMPKFDGPDCALFLKKCKQMGKITALDTAWDSKGRWMSVLSPALAYVDYFLPSYDEAVQLAGGETDPEKIAAFFLEKGPHTVVIKLGKDGCFIRSKSGEKYTIPTYSRIKPVDTTGAGDSFCAGFLSGLIYGWSLYECGRFANAVGTHCIMAPGASTGIKSKAEILKFMEEYEAGK